MSPQLSLTLFAHLCDRPEEEIDLGEAALLLAEIDHPGVDMARCRAILDDLGAEMRAAVARAEEEAGGSLRAEELPELRVDAAVRWLYEEVGFHGNQDDYYDPRNSFLDEVLARKTGIPITLAVVLIEIGRRAGFDLRGVSFPGHFLVRAAVPGGALMIDPFRGRLLTHPDVRALYARATGEDRDPPPRLLEAAGKRQILLRMLTNLRGIYASRSDLEHLRAVLERMQVLAPSDELRKEIAALGGSTPFRSGGHSLN